MIIERGAVTVGTDRVAAQYELFRQMRVPQVFHCIGSTKFYLITGVGMVRFDISYEGDLHCSLVHGPSGSVISTDAPVDNHGRGATFSPTDLCAASLGACMATVMGIEAQKRNLDLTGLTVTVEKIMANVPVRRIRKLIVELTMPRAYADDDYAALQHTALTCPVKESLHPDIELDIFWK